MTTKEAVTFHKLERNLFAPTIQQAACEFVKPDFLKKCTIHIAPSPGIQLGDFVDPCLDVEGVGGFFRTIEVTSEHVAQGIDWQLPSYPFVAEEGAAVEAYYSVRKNGGNNLKSPAGRYKVK